MATNGEHERQTRRLTIREIARLAGVSVATASRVANSRPDVADETRNDVLNVMRDHGFTTRAVGAAAPTGLIGITVPLMSEGYFAAILSGATETLYEQNQRAVLCPTSRVYTHEATLLERLLSATTDGALVVLPEESSRDLRRLQEHGYPFVVVDPRLPLDDGIPAVSTAHAAGARTATEHLLGLGHRRIGMITGIAGWAATERRIEGYRMALANAGLDFAAELIAGGDFTTSTGHTAAQHLLGLSDPPTAIFASNDDLAVGAMRAALEGGRSVPDDLSIVGFDDAGLASNIFPQLTTVRQPLAELGRTGVSLLNRLIAGQRIESLSVELTPRLVIRESSGPHNVRNRARA